MSIVEVNTMEVDVIISKIHCSVKKKDIYIYIYYFIFTLLFFFILYTFLKSILDYFTLQRVIL